MKKSRECKCTLFIHFHVKKSHSDASLAMARPSHVPHTADTYRLSSRGITSRFRADDEKSWKRVEREEQTRGTRNHNLSQSSSGAFTPHDCTTGNREWERATGMLEWRERERERESEEHQESIQRQARGQILL